MRRYSRQLNLTGFRDWRIPLRIDLLRFGVPDQRAKIEEVWLRGGSLLEGRIAPIRLKLQNIQDADCI
jgi:hypothetical protein